MSSVEEESSLLPADLIKVVGGELLRGRESLIQLQALLQQLTLPASPENASGPAVGLLVREVFRSLSKVLSMLDSGKFADKAPRDLAISASPEDQESKKRKIQAPRRKGYRRRASPCTARVIMSKTVEDGHSWRKYGQKQIYGAKFSRSYFRCTHKYDRGCQATRQVQRSEDDDSLFEITYMGEHTCMDPTMSPSTQGTCIIDFASNAAAGDPREAPSASGVAVSKQECDEEELSRSSFTPGSSSSEQLLGFPDLSVLEGSMAMEKYFAGTARDLCDVSSGLQYSCTSSLDLDFDIPEVFQYDDVFTFNQDHEYIN